MAISIDEAAAASPARAMSAEAVAAFLYREARLVDEHRYHDWLTLWESSDTLYWVPCNEDDIDPRRQVSIIYDDRDRLAQRVERLLSGSVLAQQPVPKMRRVVSNIELEQEAPDLLAVRSNFILATARAGRQELWAGQALHRLRVHSGAHRIVSKKVLLNNSDQEIPLLQFLI
jgi:3-phenylpropionate/cinnamic acid dioxygenase small subunit